MKTKCSTISARVNCFGAVVDVGGHAAAHEAEEVDDGFGEEAGLLVVDEGDGVFALGDF